MKPSNVPNGSPQWALHGALLFGQLSLGSLHVEAKVAMGADYGVTPLALAMFRMAGSAAVFIPICLVVAGFRLPSWRDFGTLTILAVLGIVNNQVLYLAGLDITSPMSATLLLAMIPVFTLSIIVLTGRARLTLRQISGTAVALLGIAVLLGFALPRLGDALVLLNALSYALYVVYSKEIVRRMGTLTVMAWIFGIATVIFLPIGVPSAVANAPSWSAGAMGLVVYIVLVPTILAYAINAWALRYASPSHVTVYMFLQPAIVAFLTWIQLGQTLSMQVLYAATLTMMGVGLVLTEKQQERESGSSRKTTLS